MKDYKYKYTSPYRNIVFQRKRIKTTKSKEQLHIPIDALARALYVFDHDPLLVYKGSKYFFDTDEQSGMYWQIFGDNGKELEHYNEARLLKTVSVFFIWTRIEEKLKQLSKEYKTKGGENTTLYQSTLAKWHFLYLYGYILNNNYTEELPALFKKVANGSIFSKTDNFIEKWFSRIHKLVTKCLEQNYEQSAERDKGSTQGFNFKNWLRSTQEFQKLKKEIKYIEPSDYPL